MFRRCRIGIVRQVIAVVEADSDRCFSFTKDTCPNHQLIGIQTIRHVINCHDIVWPVRNDSQSLNTLKAGGKERDVVFHILTDIQLTSIIFKIQDISGKLDILCWVMYQHRNRSSGIRVVV